jgi:glycine betaine catabolism B
MALDKAKPGDTINIQYPLGNFTLRDGFDKIAFLSGGIGITPIRSICKYAVDSKLNIDMVLVYSNRSIQDIVFKEDFDSMQKQHSKLKVAHVLCEPAKGFQCTVGYINAQKMITVELLLPADSIITEGFVGY